MEKQSQHQQHLRNIAKAKYAEVQALDHGIATGRRLELAGSGLTPDTIEAALIAQFVDIGRRLGSEFLHNTPAVALEQLAVMAITRNHDTAGLIKSLINSFMIAYITPETSEQAFGHLVSLEALRTEIAHTRSAMHAAPATTAEQPPQQLTAYQVGDNDIVAAHDPAGAIKVLCDYCGYPGDEFGIDEVELVSDAKLDSRTAFDIDEGTLETLEKTLREEMATLTEPSYLYGWE